MPGQVALGSFSRVYVDAHLEHPCRCTPQLCQCESQIKWVFGADVPILLHGA